MVYSDIKSPYDLYDYMKENIRYGYVSKYNGKVYTRKNTAALDYRNNLLYSYYLQEPNELINSGYGICYDQVELERKWFIENNYLVKTYFSTYHNHAFLLYFDKDRLNFNLFERALPKFNGIYSSNSLEDTLSMYKEMQYSSNCNLNVIKLYEYENIPFGTSFLKFIDTAKNQGKVITLKR